MSRIKSIIFSWDFITSIIILVIFVIFLPMYIPLEIIKELCGIFISILSVTFSIFFAALAIIISASNDKFVLFLEKEDRIFTHILWTFKITLLITFCTLIISVAEFIIAKSLIEMYFYSQLNIFIIANTTLFLYSTFSIFNSILDSIKYFQYRVKFLEEKKE